MMSVTREMKAEIKDRQMKKCISKIYLKYDSEMNEYFYRIFFKEETVKSNYSCEYMDSTDCPVNLDINGWLDEIAYIA